MKPFFVLHTLALSILFALLGYPQQPETVKQNTAQPAPFGRFATDELTEANFKKFIALFPAKPLPYKVGANEMNAWIERRKKKDAPAARPTKVEAINDTYSDFIPGLSSGQFSRMGPDLFTPEAVVVNNAKQIVVIYTRARGYSERKGTQYLAVYSPKGKRLSEMLIAKSEGYNSFLGCNITQSANGTLIVTTTDYSNQWANDKPGYDEDNYIASVKNLRSYAYMLTTDGDLEQMAQP